MRKPIIASLMLATSPATAQIQGEPIVVFGTCDEKSGVRINDGKNDRFGCDSAVITRSDRGTVLIQFTDRTGDDGRLLGFAGTIEGRQGFGADLTQMLAVERLYLAGGADPVPVSRGTCIMNWTGLHRTGGRLTSVLCGAAGESESVNIQALAVLEVAE